MLTLKWLLATASLTHGPFGLAGPLEFNHAAQSPQATVADVDTQRVFGLPIEAVAYITEDILHYNTYIGIGSPYTQLFHAVIDLTYADTWVVSAKCKSYPCKYHLRYYADQSATYEPDGTPMHLVFPLWPKFDGNVSIDTISLGDDIQVKHHRFVELKNWGGYDHEFDAVLGLSPTISKWQDKNSTQPHLPSPFMGLVNSGSLDRNIFSLLVPYDEKSIGDISFGTYHPELFSGPLVSHPIYPPDALYWQIEAPDVSFRHQNGTEIFNHSFAGHTAVLDSVIPGIALSTEIAQQIYAAVNLTKEPYCSVWHVPCDLVADLPELVLKFGEQDIVLRGEDYVVKADALLCFGGPFCQLQVYGNWLEPGVINLGTDFLKKVYAVFDWDAQTVSFAKPNREPLMKSVDVVADSAKEYRKTFEGSLSGLSLDVLREEREKHAKANMEWRGMPSMADRYPWRRPLYT